MPKDKEIAEAEALTSLEGNEGWKIVKEMLEGARDTALTNLANKKKTPDLETVIWYQSMYQHANNILTVIDTKIKRGVKAKKDNG